MPAYTLFNEQNNGPNLLSISTWPVLGKQNVQEKKVNLIRRMTKNNHDARAARIMKSVPCFAKQQREITTFTIVMTTWAYNRKPF